MCQWCFGCGKCNNTNTQQKTSNFGRFLFLVALVGLEPTLLAELDFESSASTNSATGPKPFSQIYFAATVRFSTFLTRRALRVGLRTGFLTGFSDLPIFFSMAFLIAAISGVRRDTGFAMT